MVALRLTYHLHSHNEECLWSQQKRRGLSMQRSNAVPLHTPVILWNRFHWRLFTRTVYLGRFPSMTLVVVHVVFSSANSDYPWQNGLDYAALSPCTVVSGSLNRTLLSPFRLWLGSTSDPYMEFGLFKMEVGTLLLFICIRHRSTSGF